MSKDGKTCLLRLRPDLKWSDGQPITADDFVYWLQVLLDHQIVSPNTFGYDRIASYSAQDAHTVLLQYKQPFGPYLSYLPFAAPQHVWGQIAHNALANMDDVNLDPKVTSGPFVVTDFASAQSITMLPNPYYVSTTLHGTVLAQLIYKAYQDRTALSEGFQAGETDYADQFKFEDIHSLSGVPGVHLTQGSNYELLDFNLAHPALQDVHVRRAIALAIDRCAIIQSLLLLPCQKLLGKSVVLPPSPDVDPMITGFSFDLSQARAEMLAAGYDCSSGPCLKDGHPFPTLHLATRNNDLEDREIAELITHDLTTLGLSISLEFYQPGILFAPYDYNGILATGQYDLTRFATGGWLDSDPTLYPNYHSSQIPSAANPGGGNWERVQDTELDRLLDEGRTTIDPAKRSAIYRQVQQIIVMRQVYTIVLIEIPSLSLVSPNIGNFFDNPTQFLNQWNIGEWYLKR